MPAETAITTMQNATNVALRRPMSDPKVRQIAFACRRAEKMARESPARPWS